MSGGHGALWRELEEKSKSGAGSAPTSWGTPPSSYRPPTPSATPTVAGLPTPARTTDPARTFGGDPTDRAYAYQETPQPGQVVEYRPPTFWQIMADLGLRALEAAIGAFAYEVAVFFTRRRFVPPKDRT